MIRVISGTTPKVTRLHSLAKTPCIHNRMVDDLLTKEGNKTGQLICIECRAVFLDPTLQKTAS
jgi:hypothetical protein